MILLRFPSREAMQAYVLAETLKATLGEPTAALFVEPQRRAAQIFQGSDDHECSILGEIYSSP